MEKRDELEKIEDLDITTGINYAGADCDFYLEILGIFVEENAAGELEQLFQSENWQEYAVKVHGVKSSSNYIGQHILGSLAEKLEHAARNGKIDFVTANHAPFIEEYTRFIEKLDKALQS